MRRSTKKIGICLVMTITMMMGLVACGKNGDSDTNPTTEIATENTTENTTEAQPETPTNTEKKKKKKKKEK